VSNIELDDRTIIKILKGSEEARPDLKRVQTSFTSWVYKVATSSNSLKLHHTHDGIEDDLEELIDLRVRAGNSFGPSEFDLVFLAILLNCAFNRILIHLRRVDAVTEV